MARTSARLNGIIFSAMDAIISIDAEQRIVLFNPAAERMFGASAQDVLGQKIDRLIPQRFREAHARHVERFGQTGVTIRRMGALSTISGLRANGEEFPIEASISQVEIAGEKLFTVVLRDISERERAEKALRESEARKAAILESALDCIVSMDQDGKVLEVNAAAERLFGYMPEEMVGKDLAGLIIPPRWREAHRQGLAAYLRTGGGAMVGKRRELPVLRRDGTEFPVELAISAFRVNGRVCFTVTLRDITQRRKTERALKGAVEQLPRAKETLEERVRERTIELGKTISDLEAFSYSLSHDLRAPLRAIHNFTDIFLQDYGANVNPDGIQLLKRAISAVERMDGMVQDLLAFNRVSRQEFQPESIDPAKLVRELINERPEFQPPRAEIHIEGRLLLVRGHTALLTQCLANLLGNAVKFVAPGVVPLVHIHTEPDGENVRLWIADNGIGLPAEAHQKIFELFQRLHSQERYEGTGVGLAIVAKAAQRMGGRVGVESEPGGGSRFWMELKAAERPVEG